MRSCVLASCDGQVRLRYRLRRFDVYACRSCEMMFRQPFPDDAELRELYEDPAYHASAYFADPLSSGSAAASPEVAIYGEALAWLEREALGGRSRVLLDVGCGNGSFLRMAAQHGWDAEGIELSEQLASQSRERFGLNVQCGDFLSCRPGRRAYDAITMWDFLEHVVDPEAVLTRAREMLAPDGILVILTIDSSSLFNVLGGLAYGATLGRLALPLELLYDARHNYYFTSRSLARLLRHTGYTVAGSARHRAYLGRWLSEPAPSWIRVAGDVVDVASVVLARQYRQLLYCRPRS